MTYYSVKIPYSDAPTKWHPTDRIGLFCVLTRGAFKSRAKALGWATEELNGQPFSIDRITY